MSRSIICDTARSATTAVKSMGGRNPLLMRKKLEMKDVYFRKNEPDREVMRLELAFDFEQYLLVAVAVGLVAMAVCMAVKIARRRARIHAARAKILEDAARSF